MKHGPIALINPEMPTVAVVPKDSMYEKMISNIQEIKSRRGPVIAIATEGDEKVKEMADEVIEVPATLEYLYPILTVVPCQLLAYHCARFLNRDIDKPRNLAKSVTALGGIPVKRQRPMESRHAIREIQRLLEEGERVVIFPEGTYYRGRMGAGPGRPPPFPSFPCVPCLYPGRYSVRGGERGRKIVEISVGKAISGDSPVSSGNFSRSDHG
jgi:hypothetical protein